MTRKTWYTEEDVSPPITREQAKVQQRMAWLRALPHFSPEQGARPTILLRARRRRML